MRLIIAAILITAALFAASCGRGSINDFNTIADRVNTRTQGLDASLAALQKSLVSFSGAGKIDEAASALQSSLIACEEARQIEAELVKDLTDASKLGLGGDREAYVREVLSAHEYRLSALTILSDRLQSLSDVFAVVRALSAGQAAASAASVAAANGDPQTALRRLNAVTENYRAAEQALTRSGKKVSLPELQEALAAQRSLHRRLVSAAQKRETDRLIDLASDHQAVRAASATERSIRATDQRIASLMGGVGAANSLFRRSDDSEERADRIFRDSLE